MKKNPWWAFDDCRWCTIGRLLAIGIAIGAVLVYTIMYLLCHSRVHQSLDTVLAVTKALACHG